MASHFSLTSKHKLCDLVGDMLLLLEAGDTKMNNIKVLFLPPPRGQGQWPGGATHTPKPEARGSD